MQAPLVLSPSVSGPAMGRTGEKEAERQRWRQEKTKRDRIQRGRQKGNWKHKEKWRERRQSHVQEERGQKKNRTDGTGRNICLKWRRETSLVAQ